MGVPADARIEHFSGDQLAGESAIFDAVAAVERATVIEIYGDTDLADTAQSYRAQLNPDSIERQELLVICPGPDEPVGGFAVLKSPMRDNLDLVELKLSVHPDLRRRGLGSALIDHAEMLARAAGRARMVCWAGHAAAGPDDTDVMVAPTGPGRVSPRDAAPAFALAHGYRLEQTDQHSIQPLPIDPAIGATLRNRVATDRGGYRMFGWAGPAPTEHLAGMARMRAGMSIDTPMGDLAYEEEVWDEDRVRRHDQRALAMGLRVFTTAAEHVASGDLVGYTVLQVPTANPAMAYQGDTFVAGDHRGHQLGLRLKLANAELATRREPQLRRVHTWNAGENGWMLAINTVLGYQPRSIHSIWSKTL